MRYADDALLLLPFFCNFEFCCYFLFSLKPSEILHLIFFNGLAMLLFLWL